MHRRHRFDWLACVALTCLALTGLVALSLPGSAAAQSAPGSIKGTVRDAESGELLDYANVLIKGTTRGTMSLGGGAFYFQGLQPGSYTVQVLYLGYAPGEQTIQVRSGEVGQLSFSLAVVIVETLTAFDVEGAAYMVEVKSAVQEQKITSERLTKYAIDSVEDAVAKQAGVVMRGGELFVRGGRSGEVSMRIDDVPVDDPLGGRAISVSNLSVEAVSTVTGGLDPEYGNAMSGVINITTRSGTEQFGGGLRFFTDDFGRQDKTYTNYDRFEFGFGGPTPVNRLTYFLSGDLTFTDGELTSIANRPEYKVQVGDMTMLKFRRRQSNNAKGAVKLAYSFNPNLKLTGEYSSSYSSNEFYAPNWSVSGYSRRLILMPIVARSRDGETFNFFGRYAPVYYGPWFERMNQTARPAIVVDTRNSSEIRQVTPILEVRGVDGRNYLVMAQPVFDGFRYPWSSYATVQEDSSFTAFNSADRNLTAISLSQQAKLVFTHNLTDETFYTIKLSRVAFDKRNSVGGKSPWEYNHGGVDSPGAFQGQTPVYQLGSDFYTDPLNPLFITTGDNPQYAEEYSRQFIMKLDLTSSRWGGHLVKSGVQVIYNDLQRYAVDSPAIERLNRFTGDWSLGGNLNVFHSYNPEAAWYIQDRWEYEGMVVNYGFRWDLFSPGSAAEILLLNDDVNKNVLKYKQQFSPRLGFAFPITERDGFSFHYGRFIQFPDRDVLFSSQDPIGNQGILGNPNLKSETTVAYQAGLKHQFNDYLAGSFAVYSKDIYDLIATTTVTDQVTGNVLARFINKAYASSRGVEFTLNKRFAENFAFDITYTYAFADGVASEQTFGANPEGLQYLPNQELSLGWDQRHTFNFSLLLSEPGSWSGSISASYGSGYPWTPNDRFARRQDPLLENSRRLPSTLSLDFQGERQFNFYGQALTLYVQAFNLINQDMVRGVGAGINPGMLNAAPAYTSYLTETGRYGGAYLQDKNGDSLNEFIPINDPRVFEDHRLFRIGLGWQF
jgi:outer membrane receptor protein involved in Fe transport